jgi:glucokinase
LQRDGDPGARKLFEAMGIALGRALASLINTLNLPLYLIGGGVASAWPLFSEWMFGELSARSSLYRLSDPMGAPEIAITEAKTRVALAKVGSNSGLLGACLLPFD